LVIRVPQVRTRMSARRWHSLHPEFSRNLYHARNVLLLLRAQGTYLFEKTLETGGRDGAHESSWRLAEVAIGVRNESRCKDRRALFRDETSPCYRKLVFALKNLKGLVFAVVDVRRWPTAGHIMRFDDADNSIGIAP